MLKANANRGAIAGTRSPWTAIFRKRWQLHLLMLIPVVYLLVFAYYPMLGVQIAFKNFEATKGIWGSPWIGFDHFKKFFSSYMFGRVVGNTVRISLYNMLVDFPLPIIFALFLNTMRNLRLKKAIQTITYMPHFISTVVIVGLLMRILNPVNGLYGMISRTFFGVMYPDDILGKPGAFTHLYIWSGVWQGLGYSSIIYIAALSGIDPELHEAAQIDGATRLQRMLHIDLPGILPTASIMFILRAGSIMNVGFEKIFLMQNKMNQSVSEVISTYVYKMGMQSGMNSFSFAAAIGLFNSVINCVLLVLVNWISRKLSEDSNSLW